MNPSYSKCSTITISAKIRLSSTGYFVRLGVIIYPYQIRSYNPHDVFIFRTHFFRAKRANAVQACATSLTLSDGKICPVLIITESEQSSIHRKAVSCCVNFTQTFRWLNLLSEQNSSEDIKSATCMLYSKIIACYFLQISSKLYFKKDFERTK